MAIEGDVKATLGPALHAGDVEAASGAARAALDRGEAVDAILTALRSVMEEVGEKYRAGEYFIPELIMSGQAAQGALAVLLPRIAASSTGFLGTIVLGTVAGDIHDLGKTIVFTTLSAAGFRVHDLGVDVPAAKFVEKARELGAGIVAASALMSTTRSRMKDIGEAFAQAGLREKVKIMVGGAAVTPEFARAISADGYGRDAYEAVQIARLLSGQPGDVG